MQCTVCKNLNYSAHKSKRALETKLELKRYCNHCRKHTSHKETKK